MNYTQSIFCLKAIFWIIICAVYYLSFAFWKAIIYACFFIWDNFLGVLFFVDVCECLFRGIAKAQELLRSAKVIWSSSRYSFAIDFENRFNCSSVYFVNQCQLMHDIGSAHLTFRTQPLGPEFGSGIEGPEFFLALRNFPEPGIFP